MRSGGNVLLTATRATEPGTRPARSQAEAIRWRTRARPSAGVISGGRGWRLGNLVDVDRLAGRGRGRPVQHEVDEPVGVPGGGASDVGDAERGEACDAARGLAI